MTERNREPTFLGIRRPLVVTRFIFLKIWIRNEVGFKAKLFHSLGSEKKLGQIKNNLNRVKLTIVKKYLKNIQNFRVRKRKSETPVLWQCRDSEFLIKIFQIFARNWMLFINRYFCIKIEFNVTNCVFTDCGKGPNYNIAPDFRPLRNWHFLYFSDFLDFIDTQRPVRSLSTNLFGANFGKYMN